MNLNYTAVKGMSLHRQSYQEPSRTYHWTSDGRRTLCGLDVTHAVQPGYGKECKRCRQSRSSIDKGAPTT